MVYDLAASLPPYAPLFTLGVSVPETIKSHCDYMRLRGLSPRTIGKRRGVLLQLAGHIGVPLREATPQQLADWRASLATGPTATITYISHVRQYYRWARREGLVPADPSVHLVAPRRPRLLPRPIDTNDLMVAYFASCHPVRGWLVLAAWAGMRAMEIAWLRRENVLDRPEAPAILVASDTAKGGHERIVPMSPVVAAEILPLLPRSGWLFPHPDGRGGPVQPWHVSHKCNEHLHDLGFADTLHSLRHWFGTEAYEASGDLRVVQELMGHATPAATAGYAAYSKTRARAAVAALPAPRKVIGQ